MGEIVIALSTTALGWLSLTLDWCSPSQACSLAVEDLPCSNSTSPASLTPKSPLQPPTVSPYISWTPRRIKYTLTPLRASHSLLAPSPAQELSLHSMSPTPLLPSTLRYRRSSIHPQISSSSSQSPFHLFGRARILFRGLSSVRPTVPASRSPK